VALIEYATVRLADDLPELTPDIFTSASAIIGIRGSGKTNDGVLLAEEAVRIGVPIAVIDPTGVWWGLKSSRNGKSAGLPVYVFGGQHGDIPLDAHAGPIIARFIVDNRVPIVLDLSDLTKGMQRRLVGQFATTLFDLKARQRDPLFVIIDEVARFCPQRIEKDFDLTTCLGAVEDVTALGRSRGLGIALIGQRPASINKNVLTQADNLIAMRTVGVQDRKALDEWVEAAQGDKADRDQMVRELPSLPQGEGYFWSPAIFGIFRRVKFNARQTFDSSGTPKVGETRIEPTAFAKVDLDALKGEIAAAVEKAAADDPRVLHARITQLEKELRARPAAEPQIIEKRVLGEDDIIVAQNYSVSLRFVAAEAVKAADAITRALEAASVVKAVNGAQTRVAVPVDRPRVPGPLTTARPPAEAHQNAAPLRRVLPVDLGGAPAAILYVLAEFEDGRASRRLISARTGYAPGKSTIRNALSTLKQRGLIEVAGDDISLTPDGRRAAGPPPTPKSSEETIAIWRGKLGGGAPLALFEALVSEYPDAVPRDGLGEITGINPTTSTMRNALSKLRSNGLITDHGQSIRANDFLFPTGAL
jgi:hypothetical protein